MFTRYLSAIGSGTFMTLGLIYVMQFLIGLDHGDPPAPRERMQLIWADVRKDNPVQQRELAPPPVEELTRTEVPPARQQPHYSGLSTGVRAAPTPPPIDGIGGIVTSSDNPLVVMFRVQPAYPTGPQTKGLEGFVIVEFDVLENGSVANVRVIDSSHGSFERAAINAAKRFKYKARVVNGVPQVTTGVRNKFTFRMENRT